jgi:hypothetical protein
MLKYSCDSECLVHNLCECLSHVPYRVCKPPSCWCNTLDFNDKGCKLPVIQLSQPLEQLPINSIKSEPKGWGPLRLYHITLCILLCTTVASDSHRSSCQSHYMPINSGTYLTNPATLHVFSSYSHQSSM